MIKRYEPELPDGIRVQFTLPEDYILGTDITLFVNGQLVLSMDDEDHPYGYFLDLNEKIFTFYTAPYSGERLYVMYEIDDVIDINFENIDWSKSIKKINIDSLIRKVDFNTKSNKIMFEIKTKKEYWQETHKRVIWENNIKRITFNVIEHQ